MSKAELVIPFVHLNGTSRESLLEQREAVYGALSNVMDALREMAPNGRDYYPAPGRMELALEQHRRRQKAVSDLMKELEDECRLINDDERIASDRSSA